MKKFLTLLLAVLVIGLAACGTSNDTKKEDKKADADKDKKEERVIKVGASSTPHAEILKEAVPLLEKEGIKLEIEEYQDYVFPNDDLNSGKLDANYFQHIPYLEQTIKDTGYKLENIGDIHIEPMGIYSKNIKSVDDIKDKTEVIMSSSVADHGRVLMLFEEAGLIKLKDGIVKADAKIEDIVENKKKLDFKAEVEPGFQPEIYEKEKDALVAINTNYAIQAGLDPAKDSIIIEDDHSPYVNIIAARAEDKDNTDLKKLVDVLHSKEIQDFILDKYKGAVVPVDAK